MSFVGNMSRFAAPGPLGTTNLRAALASARAADAASPPVPMIGQSTVRNSFSHIDDPEAGPATDKVTPKDEALALNKPASDAAPSAVAITHGSGPSGLLAGTPVDTEAGRVPVESLAIGDRILTADAGIATVRWVATCQVSAEGDQAPVRFARNVLRNDKPLIVSPMQRVLISGPEVMRFNGTRDALIAAHALVDGRAITRVDSGSATYVIVMLDSHQLIWAGNTLVESFFPDLGRLLAMPQVLMNDFCRKFNGLAANPQAYGTPIRPILHDLEAVALSA